MGRSTLYLTGEARYSQLRSDARQTTPAEIARAWLAVTRRIPPQFAVGTAYHESGYALNELDIEPNGHSTGGLFQLDVPTAFPLIIGDAVAAGMPEKSVYRLDDACAIFAALCERRLERLIDATNIWNENNRQARIDEGDLPDDIWSYLAIAHNQGLGAALHTIAYYGLDWRAYQRRNSSNPAQWANITRDTGHGIYGDDVVTGGPHWQEEYASPFDEGGAPIPTPFVGAATVSRLRLGLFALLALLILYAAMVKVRSPLKGWI